MKRTIPYYFVILGIVLCTSSCYLASNMQTDILKPAKFTFPSEIYRVGVVSRMDMEIKRTTGFIDSQTLRNFERDSAILHSAVIGLMDGLAESPRFDVYKVVPPRVLKGKTSALNNHFSWKLLEEIAKGDSLDMIVSLTSANFTDTVIGERSGKQIILFPVTYWRIYDLIGRKVVQHISRDTLYSDPYYGSYPSNSQMISFYKYALNAAGYKFSRKMAPYWELEDRVWFPSGSYAFSKAGQLALSGNWTEAGEIWNKYAYSKRRTVAAKACFNMALTAEMQDRLDLSLVWLECSKELGLSYYADYYIDIIKERQKIQQVLDGQMK